MKRKGAFLIALVTALLSVSMVLLPYQTPTNVPSVSDVPSFTASLEVLAIGNSTPLFEKAIQALKNRGVHINHLEDVPSFTEEFAEGTAVLFDGDWLKQNWQNRNLHGFLRDIVPKKCRLAAIGGETSNFFKALDKAGVFEIPVTETGVERNPAYMNPPAVGYRVKVQDGFLGDEIFEAYGNDAVSALLMWMVGA